MDDAAVFAQGDIFDVVVAVFDLPVPPLELKLSIGKRQGDTWWRIEEESNVLVERGLVLFNDRQLDDTQIVTTQVAYLSADGALAEERVTGEHSTVPIDALDEVGSYAQLRFRLVDFADWLIFVTFNRLSRLGAGVDRFLGQADAKVVQVGRQSVDGAARGIEGQTSALRLAIG
jgi:hypothetical protein